MAVIGTGRNVWDEIGGGPSFAVNAPSWGASMVAPETMERKRNLTNLFGLLSDIRPVATSPRAEAVMSPEQLSAVTSTEDEESARLMKILSIIGMALSPPLGLLGATLGGVKQFTARAGKEGAVRRAEEIRRQDMMEGLAPTEEQAVPGYMSIGEARGRTTLAGEERAQAAADKALAAAQLKTDTVLAELLQKVAAINPQAALELGILIKTTSSPFAYMTGADPRAQAQGILDKYNIRLDAGGNPVPAPSPVVPGVPPPAKQGKAKSKPRQKISSEKALEYLDAYGGDEAAAKAAAAADGYDF